MANEVVEDYKFCGKSGFVFKIDFEKAYDRVEWDFLDLVLSKEGFGDLWQKWIRGYISTTTFSIFIYGRKEYQGTQRRRFTIAVPFPKGGRCSWEDGGC
uniref:Reverse transcriptase domain-containing protein n=1 Tax=Cannabis sativa TaxID=3483 RepID=A0A803QBK2_CANSA